MKGPVCVYRVDNIPERQNIFLLHIRNVHKPSYIGTCGGCKVPTKTSLPLSFSAGQGRDKKNAMKDTWVKVRTGSDHLPSTVIGKTDSTRGTLISRL